MNFWKKCSSCKKEIGFGTNYYRCNVSTCNRHRTGLQFCSVECWEIHLPVYRHRDAWSLEERAPTQSQWEQTQSTEAKPPVPKLAPKSAPGTAPHKPFQPSTTGSSAMSDTSKDVLVVASKLKAYIKEKSSMSTSADVMPALSDRLRRIADDMIAQAQKAGRKTVMARDLH